MQELNFNLFNVLIATGIVHGFLFCVFVLAKQKYRTKLHIFLALTLAALAFSNLQYWLYDTHLNTRWPFLSAVYIQIELLIGPCFYLFVESYLQKKVSNRKILLLLTPFIIGSLSQFYFSLTAPDGEIPNLFNVILEYATILMNLILAILIFRNIFKYEKTNHVYSFHNVAVNTKWLKTTLIIAIILCILWAISTNIFRSVFTNGYEHYYPLWLSITGLIYWMAYAGVFYSNIFKEQKVIRSSYSVEDQTIFQTAILKEETQVLQPPKKKLNEGLFKKVESLIENQKLYTNPQLSLEHVAKKAGISSNYLSQLINNHSEQSFSDYINNKRVALAKQFLVNPEFDKYTIQSIALETGFHSKSSFYNAFKKVTHQTPTQYKSAQMVVLNH